MGVVVVVVRGSLRLFDKFGSLGRVSGEWFDNLTSEPSNKLMRKALKFYTLVETASKQLQYSKKRITLSCVELRNGDWIGGRELFFMEMHEVL